MLNRLFGLAFLTTLFQDVRDSYVFAVGHIMFLIMFKHVNFQSNLLTFSTDILFDFKKKIHLQINRWRILFYFLCNMNLLQSLQKRMSHNNNKRIFGVFVILFILFLYEMLEYHANPQELESYCQYGYISKQKAQHKQIQIDCLACYSFNQFSDQTGYVQLTFLSEQPPERIFGIEVVKNKLRAEQAKLKEREQQKKRQFQIQQSQGMIIYQKDCSVYECSDLLNADDIKFISNSQLIKLEALGFNQRHTQYSKELSTISQNRIKVPFRQSYHRHGFLIKYLIKIKVLKDDESVLKAGEPPNQAQKMRKFIDTKTKQSQQLEDLQLIKPIVKLYHLENSLAQRLLISAVGLIAFNEISILLLFNFVQWRIACILAGWTTYSMLKHERTQNFSICYIVIWVVVNWLSPDFYLSYSIFNILTLLLVCLGSHFKAKKPGIYIHFFWMLSVLCYLSSLQWLILSIPQLLYFVYCLGPILPSEQKLTINKSPRKRSYQEHTLIEDEDVQLKIKRELDI